MSSYLYQLQSPVEYTPGDLSFNNDFIGSMWRGVADDDTVDIHERKLIYMLNTDEVRNIWAKPVENVLEYSIPAKSDKPGGSSGPSEGHLECIKAIQETLDAPPRQKLMEKTPPFMFMFWTEYDLAWTCSILQSLPECYPHVLRLQMAENPTYSSIRHSEMDAYLRFKWAQKAQEQGNSSSQSFVDYVYTPEYCEPQQWDKKAKWPKGNPAMNGWHPTTLTPNSSGYTSNYTFEYVRR